MALKNLIRVRIFVLDTVLALTGKRTGDTLYHLKVVPQVNGVAVKTGSWTDTAFGANLRASLTVWHQRLGHASHHTILKMVCQDLTTGLSLSDERTILKTLCFSCELGKCLSRLEEQEQHGLGSSSTQMYMALCHIPALGYGAHVYVLFTDDFSGWRVVRFMKHK